MLFGFSLFFRGSQKLAPFIFQILNLLGIAVAFISLFAYLFGVKKLLEFPGYNVIAFHTAICFGCLMLAALFSSPEAGFMKLISSGTLGGRLFRNSFPLIFFIILLIGWLRIKGEQAGMYDSEFGVSIYSMFVILVFGIILFINASALTQSEESLKRSENHLRSIFENSSNGFLLIDTTYAVLEFNSIFNQFAMLAFGGSFKQGDNLVAGAPAAKRENIKAVLNMVFSGKEVRYESSYPKPDGNVIVFSVIVSPVITPEKKVEGACFTIEDISARKRKEEELNQYKHFFNSSNDLACIANVDGYFELLNPNFEKVLGYPLNELLSKPFVDFIHPEDIDAALKEVVKLQGGALTINFTNRYRKADGGYIWLEWNASPDPVSGKLYALARDITERKKAEAEILELNNELENKVQERTAQYEAVNKELEAFTYSVSHDLRAPLRAVNSYAQILANDHAENIDGDGRLVLENILYNNNKMGMLVDDLLAFSRLGKKELDKTQVNMNELAEAVVNDINRTVKHKATIKLGRLPDVLGDYSLLYHVLHNLLSNAIKYSSKKEQPVIELFAEEKKGKTVFAVKDNGAGFDMRFSDKLFGVFQRLHSEEEFEGNGVGLAIVQRIINKHGGEVSGEGKQNEGATFYFTVN